ncbi:MAG: ATP-binding protein [bacterium]|nr:ATP-binding protein [bacterium]
MRLPAIVMSMRRYFIASLLALLFTAPWAWGYNGNFAMAVAIDSISVDGDLSDWPRHLPRYPVGNPAFGQTPVDGADLTAAFRIAYDHAQNRLLVAVEVTDESEVISNPPDGDWAGNDGCELYLDVTHGARPAVQLSRWGLTESVLGADARVHYGVAMSSHEGRRVYEWWIDLATLGAGVQLEPGLDLGFDVVVEDRDADGSFTWMSWGPHTGKLQGRSRLGDLLVVGGHRSWDETIEHLGALVGRTQQRADDAEAEARRNAGLFIFLGGILLAVTFVHLLLYLFQRESRANLYHALFSGSTSIAIGLAYFLPATDLASNVMLQIAWLWLIVIHATSLLLLYTQFHGRVTRFGKLLLAWLALGATVRFVHLSAEAPAFNYGTFWSLASVSAIGIAIAFCTLGLLVLGAVLRRREGAWSVGVSFLIFAASAGVVVFRITEGGTLHAWLLAGILLPLASMSLRLVRSVSAIQQDLSRRYADVEGLSARLAEQNRSLELANIKIREGSRRVQEADRLKSAFLAHMSHDLRTPLNAIIGYTRILLRRVQGEIDARQYRNLENIRVSADNLLLLINDILDLSRIESGRTEIHIEDVDLQRLADDCLAGLQSLVPDGVELVRDLQVVAPVRTDAARVRRVLQNLLGNAVKYTESGSITLRLRSLGDGVELSVSDTGVGIPPEDLAHVFDEFRQVERKDKKREGSGLGLAIVRRSVEMLNGSVTASSTVGRGSTFTVRLPWAAAAVS